MGVPVAELALHDALERDAAKLLPPGRGRELIVAREVPARSGRADILLLTVSRRALMRRMRLGIRFESEAEAKVAASYGLGDSTSASIAQRLGVSRGYAQRVIAGLGRRSITTSVLRRTGHGVGDSLLIEAKMSRWQIAVAQARRYRTLAHQTAIAMPAAGLRTVDRSYVSRVGLGLIAIDNGQATWVRRGRVRKNGSLASQLWLGEIGCRAMFD